MSEAIDPNQTDLPVIPHAVEIRQAVPRYKYVQEVAELVAEVHRLRAVADKAYEDELTGLPNSRFLNEQLQLLFDAAIRNGETIAVAFVDLDGLKLANKEGKEVGDRVLKIGAEVVEDLVRKPDDQRGEPGDIVGKVATEESATVGGRYGGDEFLLIMPGYKPNKPGQTIEELNEARKARMVEEFANRVKSSEIPEGLDVGISVGIAVLEAGDSVESLIKRAETDMNATKDAHYAAMGEEGIRRREEDRRLWRRHDQKSA